MDDNKKRYPVAEDERPLSERVDERVNERLDDHLTGQVDEKVDRSIDRRIDDRVDERIRERLGDTTTGRDDTRAYPQDRRTGTVGDEHPDERAMEERADQFARDRSDRLARERAEQEADMRARQIAADRERDRLVDERASRLADERVDRTADERVDRTADVPVAPVVDERTRHEDERADRLASDRMATERANRLADAERPERMHAPMASRFIYWLVGVFEVLLGLRLILRLVGANSSNSIVSLIYGITDALVAPFRGIIAQTAAPGFDVQTIVAMVGYAVIGIALAKLIDVLTPNRYSV